MNIMLRTMFRTFILIMILNQFECKKKIVDVNWKLIKSEPVYFNLKTVSLESVYDKNPPNLIEYYKQALQNRCFKYIFLMVYFSKWAFWQLDKQLEKKTELCANLLDAVDIILIYTNSRAYIPYLFNIKQELEKMCGNLDQSEETLIFIFEKYLVWFPEYFEHGGAYSLGRTSDKNTKEICWEKFDSVAKDHLKYWPPGKLNEEILGEDETAVKILYQRVLDEIPREKDTFLEDVMKKLNITE